MKKVTFFFIFHLLFLKGLFANPLEEVLRLVEPQENCLEDIGVETEEEEENPAEQTLYRQCIQDICQDGPSFSSNLEGLAEGFNDVSENYIENNVEPLLDNIFSNAETVATQAVNNLEDNDREVIESIWYSGEISEMIMSQSVDIAEAYLSGLRNASPELAPEEQMALGDNAVNEYLAQRYSPEFAQSFLSLKTTQDEIEQQLANSEDQLVREIQNATPASLRERVYNISQHLEPGKQSLLSAINRYEISIEARANNDSLTGARNNLVDPIIDLLRLEAFNTHPNYREQMNRVIEAYKNLPPERRNNRSLDLSENIRTSLQNQKDVCKAQVANELSQLQDQQSATNSRNQVESAKQEFISNLGESNLYSRNTRRGLVEYLNSLMVLTPPSRESYLENLQEFNSRNQRILNNTTAFSQVVSGIHVRGGLQCSNLPEVDALNSYRHGAQLEHHQIVLGNDALVNFQQTGKSVLFHEMSHAVSAFIKYGEGSISSKLGLNRSLRCLGRGHIQGNFFQRMLRPTVPNFQEEDFADTLTARMFPETRNIACSFMNGDLPSSSNINATTSTTGDPMMQLMGMQPTHSSDVYRLLNWQYNADKPIPSSCNQAMRQENLQNEFPTRCLPRGLTE